MPTETRVMLWGLGAMGSGMAELVLKKDSLTVVAALEQNPSKVGKDLGEVLGAGPIGVTVTVTPKALSQQNQTSSSLPRPHS